MSEIAYFSMGTSDLQENANVGKDLVLDALARDKVITAEQADEMKRTYVVIVAKPSWLSRIFLPSNKGEERLKYFVAKVAPPLERPAL